MSQIIELYKELFATLFEKRANYGEVEMCFFNQAKGKNYNGELMIIGRAVNGWNNPIDKNTDNRQELLEKVTIGINSDDLEWVKEQWQNGNGEYDTKKSAFWRVSKKLASKLTTNSGFETDSIVWDNLYKISRKDSGNPSSSLINVQLEICKKILIEDIKLMQPKVIVFLTGLNWAAPFLLDFESQKMAENNEFVEYVGKYENSLIIVGQHPQGKPEEAQVEEIMNNYKLNL